MSITEIKIAVKQLSQNELAEFVRSHYRGYQKKTSLSIDEIDCCDQYHITNNTWLGMLIKDLMPKLDCHDERNADVVKQRGLLNVTKQLEKD